MKDMVVYIHGQGGSPDEAEQYRKLFRRHEVIGLEYTAQTPWEARVEFPKLFDELCAEAKSITVIANSIGAYFTMAALTDKKIKEAFFISPIVDMKKLIEDMMTWENVSIDELREKEEIQTSSGQILSWEYLSYVKDNPIEWNIPTHIIYGDGDNLTSFHTISEFAGKINATLTVMENGEHWFHTDEQLEFLYQWIKALNG